MIQARYAVLDTYLDITAGAEYFFQETDGTALMALAGQTRLDLSNPNNDCLFFAVLPRGNGLWNYVGISGKAKALIAFCQVALQDFTRSTINYTYVGNNDGRYSCADAFYMVPVAGLIRDATLNVAGWPLGPQEFRWLMSRAITFQQAVLDAASKAMPGIQFAGADVFLTAGTDMVLNFVPANAPANCGLTVATETASSWKKPIAIGAGVIAAALLGRWYWKKSKKASRKSSRRTSKRSYRSNPCGCKKGR